MRDLMQDIQIVQTIVPIVANNTAEGTGLGVDRKGFEAAELLVHVGDSGDTLSGSLYWTIKLQENDVDTAGTYADVAAGDIIGPNQGLVIDAPAEDQRIVRIGYKGKKKWLRALLTQTGTHTNGTPLGAVFILGSPAVRPITIAP